MKLTIECLNPPEGANRTVRMLVIESKNRSDNAPVLLYLHGKGQASPHANEVPHVFDHFSPPFQAIQGRLKQVTVVSPQAPCDSRDDREPNWNWRDYVNQLGEHLKAKFSNRTLLATGFSRGGLGVMQLVNAYPKLISKWALVDPQAPDAEDETKKLLSTLNSESVGWLRYGKEHDRIKNFSDELAKHLPTSDCRFVDLPHSELAVKAFLGSELKGESNEPARTLYEFLGLKYDA